jgi:hypothetical protein
LSQVIPVNGKPITIKANPVDAQGNPATGVQTTLSSDNAAVIAVTDNGDGTASVAPVALGDAHVLGTGTDLDDGSTFAYTPLAITVAPADAVSGTLTVTSDPNAPVPPAV